MSAQFPKLKNPFINQNKFWFPKKKELNCDKDITKAENELINKVFF
jgi:hypothetical protein